MNIGIDSRYIQGPNTGVTNYLINLLRSIGRIDKKNKYTIFLSDRGYVNRVPQADNFNVIVNTTNAFFWKNFWLPRMAKKLNIDVMHFPAYTIPLLSIKNSVVTVHDLIHKVNPAWFSRKELFLINLPVENAVKKAKKIIAVSENTKNDIIKFYNINSKKIAVTLEAADSSFIPINDKLEIERLRDKYKIKDDFILNVGVLFKRRNVPRLIEAFFLLKRRDNIKEKLVIIGPGKTYFNIDEYIAKFNLQGEVIYLGYVAQDDMPLFYNAASFFIYPSLYEGFGLPVLEAMSCGKAIITSNVSSLPEIAQDAGILVDPLDVESIYRAMLSLIGNEALRKKLGAKGYSCSKKFSWDEMARKTIEIYKEALV